MTRDQVVAEARKWLGVPYRDRGRTAAGVDCIGLLVMVGQAFAIPHVDEAEYSAWPRSDHLVVKKLQQYLTPLSPTREPLPGTIGVFAQAKLPGHVGIFSHKHGVVHLIHARIHPRLVVEEPWAAIPRTALRLVALFTLPGIED